MQKRQLLALMGLTVWVRRERLAPPATISAPATVPVPQTSLPPPRPTSTVAKTLKTLANRHKTSPPRPSEASPIQPIRMSIPSTTDSLFKAPIDTREQRIATSDWPQLTQAIQDCRACGLCLRRQQVVVGAGHPQAEIMWIGEGPGAEEDKTGEPFVGRAGQLLNAMLAAIHQNRDTIYIANAVKCRPPDNRTPDAHEITACRPFLNRQIALIQPKVIVALGRSAATALLQTPITMREVRGKWLAYPVGDRQIPLLVTYHPAYLLRSPLEKAKAWEDLCTLQTFLQTL